jgi:hypothetical protein
MVLLAAVVLVPGCGGPWRAAETCAWTVNAPARLRLPADLRFTVEVRERGGAEVRGMEYEYVVDWAGLRGTKHRGKTFLEEKIRTKGGTGTATINIYGEDSQGNSVPVAKHSVIIE